MSIQGEIRTLYSDREQTQAVFPRTKMSAVSDENGVGLNIRLKNAAPRNLLDNSDFRNPVNQRGQASYNSDGYCFDRWIIWHDNGGCSVTYDSDKKCIRIVTESSITLYQRLPKGVLDRNKKYTQAFGLTDGRTIIGTRIDYSPENYDSIEGIVINNGQAEIVWTALYEGEYTAETLPEYQPKGYGAELRECQRYLLVFKPQNINGANYHAPTGTGLANNSTLVEIDVPLPVSLRKGVIPSITYAHTIYLWSGVESLVPSSIGVSSISDNTLRINVYTENALTKVPYSLAVLNINMDSFLMINAEL